MIDIIPLLWARIDNRYYIHQTRVLTLSLDVKSHASVQHLIPSPGLSNTRSLAHNFKISHYPPHAQPSSQTPSNLTISANHVTDATEALVAFPPFFFSFSSSLSIEETTLLTTENRLNRIEDKGFFF